MLKLPTYQSFSYLRMSYVASMFIFYSQWSIIYSVSASNLARLLITILFVFSLIPASQAFISGN